MELSTWSEQFYLAPLGTRLYLRLGATPYRCEFCRCNFASFRPCKERFSWRRRREAIRARNAQEEQQAQATPSALIEQETELESAPELELAPGIEADSPLEAQPESASHPASAAAGNLTSPVSELDR